MKSLKCIILIFIANILILSVSAQTDTGAVSLVPTEITWTTTAYELADNGAMIRDSVDNTSLIERNFEGYILENDYLRVVLLPEFGGRILSIIYKPTGHEQLYQNPIGLPYGIGDGNFYYDWLMVYGGIFPTFPGPEHGKTWFLPWDFEVITETPEMITIEMSFVDDIVFPSAPSRFNSQATNLEAVFRVTLHANSRALDTEVIIKNPTTDTVRYEYWTSITTTPGSIPGDTRVTANTEIIAPVDEVKMPPWWPDTIAQEESTGMPDIYTYDNLRTFENWADMGIAYAYPTMSNNFWGVINHDNEEGLIRVSDNIVTPGLKIWTWGYESALIPTEDYTVDERRPYIELWAGVSPEFFIPAFISADSEVAFTDHYIPTVGLSDITHASESHLVNAYFTDAETLELQVFAVDADIPVRAVIKQADEIIETIEISSEINTAQIFSVSVADDDSVISFELLDEDDNVLLSGEISNNTD